MVKRVFLDVDGTLISKDDDIRPGTRNLIRCVNGAGIKIAIWSGMGLDYARTWCNRIDPAGEFNITPIPKNMDIIRRGDFVVDDMAEMVELALRRGAKGFKVTFFEPLCVADTELFKVLDIILSA